MKVLYPGTRVKVFDFLLYRNDVMTPLSYTMRPATVVKWYGVIDEWLRPAHTQNIYTTSGVYPDLVDVIFDHRPERVSRGHFSCFVEVLK